MLIDSLLKRLHCPTDTNKARNVQRKRLSELLQSRLALDLRRAPAHSQVPQSRKRLGDLRLSAWRPSYLCAFVLSLCYCARGKLRKRDGGTSHQILAALDIWQTMLALAKLSYFRYSVYTGAMHKRMDSICLLMLVRLHLVILVCIDD